MPDEGIGAIKVEPLFPLVEQKRATRSAAWMKHIGCTREKTVSSDDSPTCMAAS